MRLFLHLRNHAQQEASAAVKLKYHFLLQLNAKPFNQRVKGTVETFLATGFIPRDGFDLSCSTAQRPTPEIFALLLI